MDVERTSEVTTLVDGGKDTVAYEVTVDGVARPGILIVSPGLVTVAVDKEREPLAYVVEMISEVTYTTEVRVVPDETRVVR